MAERYIFRHSFRHGLTYVVLFEPAVHLDRATNCIRPVKQWGRQPTEEEFDTIFTEYIEWMHTVNGHLSEIIGGDHTFVVQDKFSEQPFWEFWVYHADGGKECVAKGDGIFDPSWILRA